MAKPHPDYQVTLNPLERDARALFQRQRTPLQRVVEALLPVLWLASFVTLGIVAIWL